MLSFFCIAYVSAKILLKLLISGCLNSCLTRTFANSVDSDWLASEEAI